MKWLDYYLQKLRFKTATKFISSNSRLLDIGCSQGEFFIFLQEKNITGTGVDPEVKEPLRALPPGITVIRSVFPSEQYLGDNYDTITALAVFEHIPEMEQKGFAKACYPLLSDKGKVIITVPSPFVDYILHFLKFFRVIDAMNPEQHYGFRPKNTTSLFSENGFRLVLHTKFEFGLNNLFVFEKNNE
jgi:2-polyprenyl-3-methyl-5-hydroxy-6-metoxy-1,4-benzoquinol methylase